MDDHDIPRMAPREAWGSTSSDAHRPHRSDAPDRNWTDARSPRIPSGGSDPRGRVQPLAAPGATAAAEGGFEIAATDWPIEAWDTLPPGARVASAAGAWGGRVHV